jgi:hypothetical protein
MLCGCESPGAAWCLKRSYKFRVPIGDP